MNSCFLLELCTDLAWFMTTIHVMRLVAAWQRDWICGRDFPLVHPKRPTRWRDDILSSLCARAEQLVQLGRRLVVCWKVHFMRSHLMFPCWSCERQLILVPKKMWKVWWSGWGTSWMLWWSWRFCQNLEEGLKCAGIQGWCGKDPLWVLAIWNGANFPICYVQLWQTKAHFQVI